MRLTLFGLLAIILLTGWSGEAAKPAGTLQGIVRDPTGAVVAEATILIQYWEISGESRRNPIPIVEPFVYTNSEGKFGVSLQPGLYDVFVSFPAFSPFAKRVRIVEGQQTSLECKLSFDPLTEWVE